MIKLGFSTSNMFLSEVIRDVTQAEYSHCWFMFEVYGEKLILQADIGGVQIDTWAKATKKWSKIKLVDLPDDFDLRPGLDHLSENYGYIELIGDFWVYLGRWLKKKWKNPFGNTKVQVCSELVTLTLQQQLKPLAGVENFDLTSVSPEDLDNLVTKLGLTQKIL